MANSAIKGLMPTGHVYPPTKYSLTAGTSKVYLNSPVKQVAAGTVSIAANTGAIRGSVAGFKDGDGIPQAYYPGDETTGWTVMVHDHPDQLFIMSEDGDTTDIALADRGNTAVLINATAGSTVTGLSSAQIDSSSAASASQSTDQVRIINKLDAPDNALGDDCRWIVKINAHDNVDNTAGV